MNKAKVFQGYKYIVKYSDGRQEYVNSLRDLNDFKNKYQDKYIGGTIELFGEENELYKVAECHSQKLEDVMLMRQMNPSNREYDTYLNPNEIKRELENNNTVFVLGLGELKNTEELY